MFISSSSNKVMTAIHLRTVSEGHGVLTCTYIHVCVCVRAALKGMIISV